jgi:crossover junction endodeoxyribonuclease RuvC
MSVGCDVRPSTERILGIDPGTVATGWGVVEMTGSALVHVDNGTIACSAGQAQGMRLKRIYHGLCEVIARHRPDGVSLEKVFFAQNAASALKLGQARGVALLAAAENDLILHEYASVEIKQSVVGYGHASKEQVQKMVGSLLRLGGPLAADAADALAAAICDLHQRAFKLLIDEAAPRPLARSARPRNG